MTPYSWTSNWDVKKCKEKKIIYIANIICFVVTSILYNIIHMLPYFCLFNSVTIRAISLSHKILYFLCAIFLWSVAISQQHVCVRNSNYISQDSLKLFCSESKITSESRVQTSWQFTVRSCCLRWAFEKLLWNLTKRNMLARAFANGLCNRLSKETTRTVGLGLTGRQNRQASTEVCTVLGSSKSS